MAINIMDAVWRSAPYTGTRLLVLLALADAASQEGYCWPSMRTIAQRARCNEHNARLHVHTLERDGWIDRLERSGQSNLYRVYVAPKTTAQTSVTTPVATDSPPLSLPTPPPVATDTPPLSLPTGRTVIEPSKNHQRTSLAHNGEIVAPAAPPERRTQERDFRVIRPAMERDPLFTALANELHTRPVTRHEWGQWAKCINDLREVEATPGQVTAAVRAFHRLYPQAHCTVFALLKNWGTLTQREGMYGTAPIKTAAQVDAEHATAQAEHERRQREWAAFEAKLVADGIVGAPLRR